MAPPRRASGIGNTLLASLPPAAYARVAVTLAVTKLRLKDYLQRPGEPVLWVYFPGSGFCSIVKVMQDGQMVEIATVGREGAIGLAAISGGPHGTTAVMVQGRIDSCERMAVADFVHEMDRREAFYDLLTDYTQALTGSIIQSTACHAVHSVEQRLARWLLTARDRMASNEFALTQEFAAMMLGSTRPTVSLAAAALQRAGLITYHRGQIAILEGAALERMSCECYAVTAALMNDVTGGTDRVRRSV